MINKQGRSIVEDKTPPMGSMLVGNRNNIATKKDGVGKIGSVKKLVTKCFLVHNKTNKKVEINKYPFTIGRLSKDDMKISNNQVSRNHAIIDKKNGTLFITNNSSLNGLRVNDHPVERIILHDDDVVSIASEAFTIKIEEVMQSGIAIIESAKKPKNKKEEKAAQLERLLNTQTSPVIEAVSDNISAPLIKKNEINKKRKPFFKLAIFSLTGIAIASIGVYGYQHYLKSVNESRVFVVTDAAGKINNKDKMSEAAPKNVVTEKQSNAVEINIPVVINKPLVKKRVNVKTVKTQSYKKKVVAKRKSTKATNKRSLKKAILFEYRNSKALIKNAENLYHSGRYAESVDLLTSIEKNKRHHSEFRVNALDIKVKIKELYDYYINGTKAFDGGQKDEAFTYWVQLLNKHKVYFPNKNGFYTNRIKELVASEYETRGNNAFVKEKWSSAYSNWKNSLAMRPKSAVQKSVQMMDAEIKELYRTGYRYETVNIARALDYWNALVKKAPADHEYYIKATAKINWYKNAK